MSALRVALARFSWKALPVVARSSHMTSVGSAAVNGAVWRRYGHGQPEDSDEDYDPNFWVEYFNQPDIDAWDLQKGLYELCLYDRVPEPKIVAAMLYAARRANDIRVAIYILEAIKSKAAHSVFREIKPTLDELGLKYVLRRSYM